MHRITLNSYAKLNLYLRVINKRADGYHNIESIFERISLADKISIKPRKDNLIKITCRKKGIPSDPAQNLAFRSAKLLQEKFGIKSGVEIKITKHIPVASGMGGGSSNAAGVLLGLNRLWALGLSKARLSRLGLKIGSDVPFFIYQTRFAQVEGRGEKITPLASLKKRSFWHVLLVPKVGISSGLIYKKWDHDKSFGLTPFKRNGILSKGCLTGLTKPDYDVKILKLGLRKNNLSVIAKSMFNGLQEVTFRRYPQIAAVKNKLVSLGLKAILMSGSGPAIFAIASSRKEARALCRQLAGKGKFWQTFMVRTI